MGTHSNEAGCRLALAVIEARPVSYRLVRFSSYCWLGLRDWMPRSRRYPRQPSNQAVELAVIFQSLLESGGNPSGTFARGYCEWRRRLS